MVSIPSAALLPRQTERLGDLFRDSLLPPALAQSESAAEKIFRIVRQDDEIRSVTCGLPAPWHVAARGRPPAPTPRFCGPIDKRRRDRSKRAPAHADFASPHRRHHRMNQKTYPQTYSYLSLQGESL